MEDRKTTAGQCNPGVCALIVNYLDRYQILLNRYQIDTGSIPIAKYLDQCRTAMETSFLRLSIPSPSCLVCIVLTSVRSRSQYFATLRSGSCEYMYVSRLHMNEPKQTPSLFCQFPICHRNRIYLKFGTSTACKVLKELSSVSNTVLNITGR